jgi:hypothetical protein
MLVSGITSLPDDLTGALRSASARSGTSFDYLLKTAMRESGMNASATARTSSATGLFQFIEQTWLELVKDEGPRMGLGAHAAQIEERANGTYHVADPAARREILALRKDPEISAAMAGEFARRNAEFLSAKLGRAPTEGELYIAHFLGAGGASRLIRHAAENPTASAADLFPAQAASNRGIFYKRNGTERSIGDVYANLVSRHGDAPVTPAGPFGTAMAFADIPGANGAQSAAEAIRSRFGIPDGAETRSVRRETDNPAERGLPGRFALAALQTEEGNVSLEAQPRLRPVPGSSWSDEGPADAQQLAPIAGRFAPR